ncbi:arginine--tRNA ligase [Salipaludibacillus agaradhaerens]|uniref:arginine--tRNA ligase n=1 Tax=Salipaludibacillus agaradhaerens TaxID=76935 RepID=UPI0021519C4C|nr:arginine--tRNA ligase [Salipaludibacillus agaradhaerens]MCR6108265.1 arginine--tRNA ligase [Salipaludibacillus agaradhaerens]MCR6120290.1 arginine--tRNA ligase [Salipaludibacillus agaradhaerens]
MSQVEQLKEGLKKELAEATVRAGLASIEELPEVVIETPKDKTHGDFATNLAMQLARVAKKAPKMIAEDIVAHFNYETASVEKLDIAGPGFINFFMKKDYLIEIVSNVLEQKDDFGSTNVGNGKKIQVEFVSANPTGTLHLGHARGAAVGDSLCNILEKAGYDVAREYYINDAGNQIDNLALSLEARYLQELGEDAAMPEDGYQGKDIIGFAKEIVDTYNDRFKTSDREERLAFFREYGLKRELDKLKKDLADFRVNFDNWFSETSLYEDGKVELILEDLKKKGKTYEKEGAIWFQSTEYGDDKDRVLVKSDGSYTYLTPDISYHKDKFSRGFDELINIWGADHHGYIPRMKAAVQAMGYDEDQLGVQIIQMVNLFENGEKVKMSKRTGKAVTMRDLMEEVGIDATRYFFAMRAADTHLDFDLDLAKSQSNENPVFYVQYAHARICSMLRQATDKGYTTGSSSDLSLLTAEKEQDLMKKLGEFPEAVADAATRRSPHRITHYVHELAQALHSFYNAEKVINENEALTNARLSLMEAVRLTLSNGLALVGVEAPEKM